MIITIKDEGFFHCFFGLNIYYSMLISPWSSFATWLHLEAPQENIGKINKNWVSNIELILTHTISKLGVFGIAEKLLVSFVTFYLEKLNYFLKKFSLGGAKIPNDHILVDWNFTG